MIIVYIYKYQFQNGYFQKNYKERQESTYWTGRTRKSWRSSQSYTLDRENHEEALRLHDEFMKKSRVYSLLTHYTVEAPSYAVIKTNANAYTALLFLYLSKLSERAFIGQTYCGGRTKSKDIDGQHNHNVPILFLKLVLSNWRRRKEVLLKALLRLVRTEHKQIVFLFCSLFISPPNVRLH